MLNEIPAVSRKSEVIYHSYKVSFQAEKKGRVEELKFVSRRLRFFYFKPIPLLVLKYYIRKIFPFLPLSILDFPSATNLFA